MYCTTFKQSVYGKLGSLLILFSLTSFLSSCTDESVIEEISESVLEEDAISGGDNSPNARSSKSVKLDISSVSASSSQSPNVPNNVLDGDLSTRWSGFGVPTDLYFDLGNSPLIDYARIAFFKGNQRRARFEVFVRNSTNSAWEKINTKTSSGTTTGLEIFDFSNRTARYLRLRCNGNTSNNWNSITEVELWGTPDSSSGDGDGDGVDPNSARGILGGMQIWKLNAYTGNLNIGSSSNGLSYADDASKSDNPVWFYPSNGYAYFLTYPGNPTSGGSSNPRTELRELNPDGSLAFWDGTTSTEHSMKWRFRVDDLPPSGKLCFGQIHERSDALDDVIRVQCEGSANQTSGTMKLRILGYVTEQILGSGQTVPNFTFNMDQDYYFELTFQNRIVKLYELNNNGSRIRTLFTSQSVNADENYFKAGCYLQSTRSSHRSSSSFGLVGIKNISVSH